MSRWPVTATVPCTWNVRVHPKEAGLDPDDCRLLCEGVCHNRRLRKLDVKVKTVHRVSGVAAPGAPHSRGRHRRRNQGAGAAASDQHPDAPREPAGTDH
jgi:hypothetical protein